MMTTDTMQTITHGGGLPALPAPGPVQVALGFGLESDRSARGLLGGHASTGHGHQTVSGSGSAYAVGGASIGGAAASGCAEGIRFHIERNDRTAIDRMAMGPWTDTTPKFGHNYHSQHRRLVT